MTPEQVEATNRMIAQIRKKIAQQLALLDELEACILQESTKETRYELFYASGGHGGPHLGLANAIHQAKCHLNGCPHERAIHIKPYENAAWSSIKPVCTMRRNRISGVIKVIKHR